jgi:hypothetical protein
MGPGIEIGAERTVGAADYDDRPLPDRRRDVIAMSRDLALVSEVDPAFQEQVVDRSLECRGIGIDRSADPKDAVLGLSSS